MSSGHLACPVSPSSSITKRTSRRSHTSKTEAEGSPSEAGIKSEVVLPGADEELEDTDLEVVKRCLGMTEDDEDDDDPTATKTGPSTRSIAALNMQRSACIQFFVWLADHVVFTSVFMFLTFYALFAPDIDQLCGNKTSRFVCLVVNTVVCAAFIFEITVMSLGKEKYFFRPYFLLDTVALVSMLPDTWVMQVLLSGQSGFVAGRSSRIARIIRVASRSSKATRLNRLTRIARVASLLPKFGKLFGHHVNEKEIHAVLNKKLNRVFRLFDDDMDGRVARGKVTRFLESMKVDIVRQSTRITTRSRGVSGLQQQLGLSTKSRSSTISRCTINTNTSAVSAVTSDGSHAVGPNSEGTMVSASRSDVAKKRSSKGINWADNYDEMDESDMVDFQTFSDLMLQDSIIGPSLRKAVDVHLRKRTNTKNITTRHSEYVAVRVALGVILLLFLLGFVAPNIEDEALVMGLEFMVETVRLQYPNATAGSPIPEPIHQQVKQWRWNVRESKNRKVLWLDVEHLTYCDAFNYGEANCTWNGVDTAYWGKRISLNHIDDLVQDSDYRAGDMDRIRTPEIDDGDLSDQEMSDQTIGVAVIDDRGHRQKEAAMSICTTFLIILVILSGIFLLTQDLTQMSSQLLKPLRELADDMESLTQLQLAGAEDAEEDKKGKGTDEIRQIRSTFEKMKKAIKSWGKYVPWPVVQMLLRANVEADLKVEEADASMFFSDIAGFTTIVEQLQPEKSLLLLNRYFNDMTKVIDDHGGVVIEFIGDAILCIYGHPLLNPYHPSAAVKGALRMLSVLRKLNAWSVQKGLPEVNIRCGVHTGQVLVGNMGFQSRIKYGIVGEDSQIPSRLEELNKTYTSNCLISHSTFYQLVDNMFISRPVDFIRLRHAPGAEPEYIHQVLDRERRSDRSHPLWQACEVHSEAMEHYRQYEFEEAIPKFQQAGELVKAHLKIEEDGPSALLIKRCQTLIKEPPPEDWDGVWVEH